MKKIFLFCVFLLYCPSIFAFEIPFTIPKDSDLLYSERAPKGWEEYPWGTTVSVMKNTLNLKFMGTNNGVDNYMASDVIVDNDNQPIYIYIFGFYEKKLVAVDIFFPNAKHYNYAFFKKMASQLGVWDTLDLEQSKVVYFFPETRIVMDYPSPIANKPDPSYLITLQDLQYYINSIRNNDVERAPL